jgi:phosphoglycerate-specific signal transduction histidine kinase
MRLTIALKLFFGFLVVIFLNVFFFVIISKIDNVRSITQVLKKYNDIKTRILKLRPLHRVQGTSVLSFESVKRPESVENFRLKSQEIIAVLDTINSKLDSIKNLDLIIPSESDIPESESITTLQRYVDSISIYNNIYSVSFDSLVSAKLANLQEKQVKPKRDILDQADARLSMLLDSSEQFIDRQTNIRLKDVEIRISKIKQLTIGIIAGVTLFAIFFGFIFSRYITNALRRLKDAASTIGRGDFNVNPHGYPTDEIGDLATAFFDMAIDLKNKEERLIQLQRMAAIGEVVASVNHEINNPLMIISGNAQFLEMIMEGYPQEMRERVQTILEETERISKVTRKLREIKNPVVEDYTSSGEQMINLDKSST